MPKPRINARSVPILLLIHKTVMRGDYRGDNMFQAAADVLDGSALRNELDDLIRRRFLTVVDYEKADGDFPRPLCGTSWSVDLTPKAMRTFWPDRMPSHSLPVQGERDDG